MSERVDQTLAKASQEGRLVLIQSIAQPEINRPAVVHNIISANGHSEVVVRALAGGEYKVGAQFLEDGFAENRRGSWRFYQIPMTPEAEFVYKVTRAS